MDVSLPGGMVIENTMVMVLGYVSSFPGFDVVPRFNESLQEYRRAHLRRQKDIGSASPHSQSSIALAESVVQDSSNLA